MFTFEDGTEYDGPFLKDRMVDRQIKQSSLAASPEKEKKGTKKDEKEKPDSPKTEASKRAKKEVE